MVYAFSLCEIARSFCVSKTEFVPNFLTFGPLETKKKPKLVRRMYMTITINDWGVGVVKE